MLHVGKQLIDPGIEMLQGRKLKRPNWHDDTRRKAVRTSSRVDGWKPHKSRTDAGRWVGVRHGWG